MGHGHYYKGSNTGSYIHAPNLVATQLLSIKQGCAIMEKVIMSAIYAIIHDYSSYACVKGILYLMPESLLFFHFHMTRYCTSY